MLDLYLEPLGGTFVRNLYVKLLSGTFMTNLFAKRLCGPFLWNLGNFICGTWELARVKVEPWGTWLQGVLPPEAVLERPLPISHSSHFPFFLYFPFPSLPISQSSHFPFLPFPNSHFPFFPFPAVRFSFAWEKSF